MDYAAARKLMVDSQVRVNDVTDRALQAALLQAPRERLLPADRAYAAYAEIEPEVAAGRRLMLPRDVSKLLMAVAPRSGERALAIAGPYAAIVLARMGLEVTAQESDQAVLDVAGAALSEENVSAVLAELAHPVGENWDVIVSEAATPLRPENWLAALKPGGRLAVVERSGPTGKAILYVRGEHGFSRRELFDAAPPVLSELAPEPSFSL